MNKKIVLFDAGGVLVCDGIITDYLRSLGAPLEKALETWQKVREGFWSGKISVEQVERIIAEDLGVEVKPLRPTLEELPWTRRALSVKARIAVLSNHRSDWLVPFLLESKLGLKAEDVFVSDAIGSCKPAREIYEYALSRLGAAPSDVIFVDNKAENIKAAATLGMHGILADDKGEWVERLEVALDMLPASRPPIALHQNGFIKVELPHGRRLHVWSKYNPPGDPANAAVHDHPFAFESFVLGGCLRNTTLVPIADDNGDYEKASVECQTSFGPQDAPKLSGQRYRLVETTWELIGAGLSYTMAPWTFHRTEPGHYLQSSERRDLAITIFQKGPQEPGHGTIFVPRGNTPTERFDALLEAPELLWEAVDKALADIGFTFQDVLNWNDYLRVLRSTVDTTGAAAPLSMLNDFVRREVEGAKWLEAEANKAYPGDPQGSATLPTTPLNEGLSKIIAMGDQAVQRAAGLRAMMRAGGYHSLAAAMVIEDIAAGRFFPAGDDEADIVACLVPLSHLSMLSYVKNRPYAACVVVLSTGSMVEQMMADVDGRRDHPYEILSVERKDGSGRLGCAGGKIEPDESALDAAVRELREETGITVDARELRYVGLWAADGEEKLTACFLLDRRNNLAMVSAWDNPNSLGGRPTIAQQPGEGAIRWVWWDELIEKTPWPTYYTKALARIEILAPHSPPLVAWQQPSDVEPPHEDADELCSGCDDPKDHDPADVPNCRG